MAATAQTPVPRPGRGATINRLKLTRLRLGKSWSLEQLAAEAGIAKSTVSRIEGGKRRPSPEMLGKLAAALGVEPGELLAK